MLAILILSALTIPKCDDLKGHAFLWKLCPIYRDCLNWQCLIPTQFNLIAKLWLGKWWAFLHSNYLAYWRSFPLNREEHHCHCWNNHGLYPFCIRGFLGGLIPASFIANRKSLNMSILSLPSPEGGIASMAFTTCCPSSVSSFSSGNPSHSRASCSVIARLF